MLKHKFDCHLKGSIEFVIDCFRSRVRVVFGMFRLPLLRAVHFQPFRRCARLLEAFISDSAMFSNRCSVSARLLK